MKARRLHGASVIVRVTLVFILGTICSLPVRAQEAPSREQAEDAIRERVAEMRERLQLTEEQEEQIRPIFRDTAKKTREVRDQMLGQERSRESMTAAREKIQELQKDSREQLMGILTAEQMAEYDKMQQERRVERRQMMRERRGRPGEDG